MRTALAHWILDVYHRTAGPMPYPAHAYVSGVEKYPVNLTANLGELAVSLGKRDDRILHDYGIEFR